MLVVTIIIVCDLEPDHEFGVGVLFLNAADITDVHDLFVDSRGSRVVAAVAASAAGSSFRSSGDISTVLHNDRFGRHVSFSMVNSIRESMQACALTKPT